MLDLVEQDGIGNFSQSLISAQLVSLSRELEFFIQEVKDELNRLPAADNTTVATLTAFQYLHDSLFEFHQFSFDYFNHIYRHDRNDMTQQMLVLRKVQNELLALRPLVEQRRSDQLLRFLTQADAIAFDFIEKCELRNGAYFANQLSDSAQPGSLDRFLVFFEENTWIHLGRLAYKRVPSIGLPLRTWRSPWLWQGLAHEVGHFVYQNIETPAGQSGDLKERLSKRLEQNLSKNAMKMWNEWLEEVFADIYGVLILGPSYTDSLICQILLPNLKDGTSLLQNDRDHPICLLRPFLHLALLRKQLGGNHEGINQPLHNELERLEELWKKICTALIPPEELPKVAGDPFDFWLQKRIPGFRINIETCINEHIPLVADLLIKVIEEYKQNLTRSYTPELHIAVEQVAHQLVTSGRSAQITIPDSLKSHLPTLALSITWYAWKQAYTQPGSNNGTRIEVVQNINQWIEQLTRGQGTHQYTARYARDTPIPDVAQLIEQASNEPRSQSFKDLLAKLEKDLQPQDLGAEDKERQLFELLLNINFSTQEGQSTSIVCTKPGQVPFCSCQDSGLFG